MSISETDKLASDAAALVQVEDATSGNTLGITASNEAKVDITSVGNASLTLGQKTMANGVPVTIASDQDPLEVELQDGVGNPINSTALVGAQYLNVYAPGVDGNKATYSAGVLNYATVTSATDLFTITGSATKTVRIIRFGISGIGGSTNSFSFQLVKRSSVNSGGTTSAVTATPHDSNSAAATATVVTYSVNPVSLGTSVGVPRPFRFSTGSNNIELSNVQEFQFGIGPEQAIVLRGTSQVLALNLNGVTINGSSLNIYVQWTEE